MTKLTFVVAALVAAAACTNAASAGPRSHAPSRPAQATTTANAAVNCVRAPNVGAYASDPYTSPPCMPDTAN